MYNDQLDSNIQINTDIIYYSRMISLIVIVLAVSMSQSQSHMIVINHILVSDSPEIFISNIFKYTDILMSNQTKSIIRNFTSTTEMNEIPQVQLQYKGRKSHNYQQINSHISSYTLQTLMSQQQFNQYLTLNKLQQSHYDLLLIHKAHLENTDILSDKLCLYDNESLNSDELKQVITKCVQKLQINNEINYYPQEIIPGQQTSHLLIYAGIVVLFVSFSWLKVLLLKMVSKADSIV